jgi:hypothetical protein
MKLFVSSVGRTLVAIIVFVSALLKYIQLVHSHNITIGTWHIAYSIGMMLTTCELLFSLILLLNSGGLYFINFSILCFIIFMTIDLILIISGATNCGCFGSYHIAPLNTFLFCLISLIILNQCRVNVSTYKYPLLPKWTTNIVLLLLVTISSLGLWIFSHDKTISPKTIAQDGASDPNLAFNIGLERSINSSSSKLFPALHHDDWIILCFRNDCSHCQMNISSWVQAARYDKINHNTIQWCFINVSNNETSDLLLINHLNWEDTYSYPAPDIMTLWAVLIHNGKITKFGDDPFNLLNVSHD